MCAEGGGVSQVSIGSVSPACRRLEAGAVVVHVCWKLWQLTPVEPAGGLAESPWMMDPE